MHPLYTDMRDGLMSLAPCHAEQHCMHWCGLQVVPGGRASLVLVGVLAGGVIANQLLTTVLGS